MIGLVNNRGAMLRLLTLYIQAPLCLRVVAPKTVKTRRPARIGDALKLINII